MQVTEYQLIDDSCGWNRLDQQICTMILNGWQPFGSPFSNKDKCTQAMVKYESPKTENVTFNNETIVYGKNVENEILHKLALKLIFNCHKYNTVLGYWIMIEETIYHSKSTESHQTYPEEILNKMIEHEKGKMNNANNNNNKSK